MKSTPCAPGSHYSLFIERSVLQPYSLSCSTLTCSPTLRRLPPYLIVIFRRPVVPEFLPMTSA